MSHESVFFEGRSYSTWRAQAVDDEVLRRVHDMLGLDAGPISGFDSQKVDELFFSGTPIRSNFIINLCYGDPAGLPRRAPRPSFDDVAKIL